LKELYVEDVFHELACDNFFLHYRPIPFSENLKMTLSIFDIIKHNVCGDFEVQELTRTENCLFLRPP